HRALAAREPARQILEVGHDSGGLVECAGREHQELVDIRGDACRDRVTRLENALTGAARCDVDELLAEQSLSAQERARAGTDLVLHFLRDGDRDAEVVVADLPADGNELDRLDLTDALPGERYGRTGAQSERGRHERREPVPAGEHVEHLAYTIDAVGEEQAADQHERADPGLPPVEDSSAVRYACHQLMNDLMYGSSAATIRSGVPSKMILPSRSNATRFATRKPARMSCVTSTDVTFSSRWSFRIRSLMRPTVSGSRPAVGSS